MKGNQAAGEYSEPMGSEADMDACPACRWGSLAALPIPKALASKGDESSLSIEIQASHGALMDQSTSKGGPGQKHVLGPNMFYIIIIYMRYSMPFLW
jgi:hypothetical protein